MNASNLFRLSGLACILCGVLLPLTWFLDVILLYPASIMLSLVEFVAITSIVFGLIGIYGVQFEGSGITGFLGFLFAMLMSTIGLSLVSWAPGVPTVEGSAEMIVPLMGLAGLIGYTLLAIGSWRANKLPRWAVILWPAGTLISAAGMMFENADYIHVIGISIWGLGMIAVGIRLLSIVVEPSSRVAPAT
jgi:hypothetical protein